MSVFHDIPETSWVASNKLAFAVRDRYPVSCGHTLVITRREVPDWFAASDAERAAVLDLVDKVKRELDSELAPDGYNVGFNAGIAAGQTVMHLHVHVIPRFRGDMDDPRGGIRHAIPSKGNYLREVPALATGGVNDPFARHVLPLFDRAMQIAIVAAFVQESGLERIYTAVSAAVARGARIRLVTGDYLDITQAEALEQLLDWQTASCTEDDEGEAAGRFEAALIKIEQLPPRVRSFHPKSWRFEGPHFGVAFVGSSNLSRSALDTGIEWNLRVDRDVDADAYGRVCDAFEALWERAQRLDAALVEAYARRARIARVALPAAELEPEPTEPPPEPHQVQLNALAKLRSAREQGRRRALVVMATGLGKTLLATLDFMQLADELGRRPRLLFLAHRRELLLQAAHAYRRQLNAANQPARVGWFAGEDSDLSAELVFASVAKLARWQHLAQLRAQDFDYVVVDEVHHAAGDSYRRILDGLDPRFLLGLTATPDRADSADILGLFDDHIAFRAGIREGIQLGRLVPFHYFGIKDDIDYQNIPWRNRRFDPVVLAQAAQTEARMQTLWRAWSEHPATRSLVFCCSIAHADYVRSWLLQRGVRAAAVYAADGSDDRETSLQALANGDLDAVCAVDVFNEGVDVPTIDRVVMLRPTESTVVFLQQLGRGLRAADGKSSVTVLDFVGNDRVFLTRLRTLLALAPGREPRNLHDFLESREALELPDGCSVDIELEAKELLARLFQISGVDEVERVYRELCVQRGAEDNPALRPTAGELHRMGYLPSRVRERHGSWFAFVRDERGLTDDQLKVYEVAAEFLRDLETTEMTRSFKMVTLEVLLEAGCLLSGMQIPKLAERSLSLLRRSPELLADVPDSERPGAGADLKQWIAYWRKNPVAAWTREKKRGRTWFRIEDGRLVLQLGLDREHEPALTRLVRELVDYRLAQYRQRRSSQTNLEGFVCKVLTNRRDPILKLPSRVGAELPEGETDVRVQDGSVWQFRFAKEFCNVARPAGVAENQLPDLLRSWFGLRAGRPGTAFQVRFRASPEGLWVEPVQAEIIELASRERVVAYPDVRAAAGHLASSIDEPDVELVSLPLDDADPDLFAVRVAGTSMDGGKQPLRDGDWAVMRLARNLPASAVEGRVVLVEVLDDGHGAGYQIKRLRRQGRGWRLTSDNPDGPSFDASSETVPIARLEHAISPDLLAPPVGTAIAEPDLARHFGVEQLTPHDGRQDGHLFLFVDREGILIAPDRLRAPQTTPRPSETAFALAQRPDTRWRYLGVARQTDEPGTWAVPEVDHATWRRWGKARSVSRRLPAGAQARAQLVVDTLVGTDEHPMLERADGTRARILGQASRGGLRIGGEDNNFRERTVSLLDLAWTVAAADDVAENGGVLDEARVNKLRYLEGTPHGSTRWIDTGWAIAAWQLARPLITTPIATDSALLRVHRDDGTKLDASFRLERVGDSLTIVYESRGGTRGSLQERNVDYNEGLELVLRRLATAGAQLADVQVESATTANLEQADRRLAIDEAPYPITIDDPASLRRKLSAAQAKVGRREGARGGGNQTRRLRIFVAGADLSAKQASALLTGMSG